MSKLSLAFLLAFCLGLGGGVAVNATTEPESAFAEVWGQKPGPEERRARGPASGLDEPGTEEAAPVKVASKDADRRRHEKDAPEVLAPDDEPVRVSIAGPSMDRWKTVFEGADLTPPSAAKASYRLLQAEDHLAPIWKSQRMARVAGRMRGGAVIEAWRSSKGCKLNGRWGRWYKVDGGWLCSRQYDVVEAPSQGVRSAPDTARVLPYEYKKVSVRGEPLYGRLPTLAEVREVEAAIEAGKEDLPDPVRERANGAYWLALEDQVAVGERTFWRTLQGDYVDATRFDERPMPEMYGEVIDDGEADLPLAFSHLEEGAEVECQDDSGAWLSCGQVEKHGRFHVAGRSEEGGREYVHSDDGWRVPRDQIRLVEKRGIPYSALATERWVHVDLDEQAFIAYEGREPVFASLISSGIGRFATPEGLYRVQRKYLTKTMIGPDPDVGKYHIEEIPWVMYYKGGYAVHGAYWHNTFGNVRSHGCTNLAPADARWLYHWSAPEVPDAWHALVGVSEGAYFYFERD